ncbi:MAG: ATP-binding protein [Flavobacteriales bacterium]
MNQHIHLDLLKRSVELAGVGSWEYDPASDTMKWDMMMYKIHEKPDHFVPNREHVLQTYGIYAKEMQEAWNRALTYGESWEKEVELQMQSGLKWIRCIGKPLMIDNVCKAVFGVVQDINKQKRSEEALRNSEERFKSLIQNNSDIISLVEPSGKLIFQSSSITQVMHWEENELAGKNLFELIHPDDFPRVMVEFRKIIAHPGLSPVLRFRIKDRNGDYLHIEARGNNQIHNPHIGALVVNSREIGELVKAEKNLHDSEERAKVLSKYYESIVESKSFFVVKFNAQGQITFSNTHYKTSFGRGASDHLSIFDGLVKEDVKSLSELLMDCNEFTLSEFIIKRTNYDESNVSVKWEFSATRNETGQIIEYQGVGFDITEQIDSLRESKRLLEITTVQNSKLRSFAHIISHNIRNHSANLSGLVELLMDTESEEEQGAFTQLIKTSADNLEKTILDLNKIIAINQEAGVPREMRNLRSEIYKTIEIFSLKILKLNVEMKIEVNPQIQVRVVSSFLDSILLNLIDNAFKYRKGDRPLILEFTADEDDDYIILKISDNGVGVDLDQHGGKIFGLYKTFHGNKDARGMGLFIVKSQVEDMGGKIEVSSVVGEGTTFTVFFKKGVF